MIYDILQLLDQSNLLMNHN